MSCYFPFKVDNPNFGQDGQPAKIPVGCGKCPYCLQRRSNNWVFRCMQHAKTARSAIWCTLTYSQPPLDDNNMMTLRKRDPQNFFKRLRDRTGTKDIKYYLCGEYGDNTERPHFHAVIFNASAEDIEACWTGFREVLSTGEFVQLGICDFDEVNENTVMYTAKYMNKGKLIPKFEGDKRLPEFQLFSKGLGANYLTPEIIKYHQEDISRQFAYVDGFKKALPRYFRLKVYTDEQRTAQAALAQAKASEKYQKQYDEYMRSKSANQTFEEFRYSRKVNALSHFRKHTSKRKKM